MKTRSTILVLALMLISLTSFGQDLGPKEKTFVDKFITTVASNNEKKTLKFLDKAYAKEQLKNLEGDKKQLVNELFGGEDINDPDNYHNIKISEVTSIKLEQVVKLKGEDTYTIFFRIRKGDVEVISTLQMKKNGKKYGFVGAMG